GITMFYMGLMEIATQSGLAQKISKVVAVIIKPVFPRLKKEEPAMQAICMNLSANALGLGNVATPLGLTAMEELQKKNKDKQTATQEMIGLIVLNASSVQLIPTSIALQAAAGSAVNYRRYAAVWLCTTLTGAVLCRVMAKK
ncbi:MAG: nucleoside recognition domain-containing protein, partial [Christensenellales bacterium]